MTSYSSSKRHRCLANESYKVSDNPDDIIIAIDKDNKIIYMTNQSGYGYGSPSDNFYMANKNKEDLINKCFILNNNFQYYKKDLSNNEYLNYEFVVPKKGFVIIGDNSYYDFLVFISLLFDNKYKLNELKDLLHNNELFEEQSINGQFNKLTCELVDDTLTISRQYTDEEILLDKISQKIILI